MSGVETTEELQSAIIDVDEPIPTAGLSYVLKEEEQLAQVWSADDRTEHEKGMRDAVERLGRVRPLIEALRTQSDLIWERFITLTLERVLSQQLRVFLDQIDTEILMLSQHMVEAECEMDRIRSLLQKRCRLLEDKVSILEPMAHRTSTQTHLNMMLARVEGLEAYLLGKKDVAPEVYNFHYKRHTTLPGDLLYMRVRLLTTRVAVDASTRSKHLSELHGEVTTLLIEADRTKAELITLATRLECMSELSRYWLAYLNISQGEPEVKEGPE